MKSNWKELLNNEAGEFGIKQIAITVAVIIIIGALVTVINGNLGGWVTQVWNMLIEYINETIGS